MAEVLTALDAAPGRSFLDGTVGAGGHADALLDRTAPDGRLLGLDRDPAALEHATATLARFGDRAVLVRANFAECDRVAREHGLAELDGVLLDLGLSSFQLADNERGFSFRSSGPLDMRADPDQSVTAADIVNDGTQHELRRIFLEYGEEPEAARLAAAIVRRRATTRFTASDEFGRFVAGVKRRRPPSTDPATRVFQALRIAVNDEIGSLRRGLTGAVRLLKPGGRLAVITFHSLEDRVVKEFGREQARDYVVPGEVDVPELRQPRAPVVRLVTRKAICASDAEVAANPRARSAQLRVMEKA